MDLSSLLRHAAVVGCVRESALNTKWCIYQTPILNAQAGLSILNAPPYLYIDYIFCSYLAGISRLLLLRGLGLFCSC